MMMPSSCRPWLRPHTPWRLRQRMPWRLGLADMPMPLRQLDAVVLTARITTCVRSTGVGEAKGALCAPSGSSGMSPTNCSRGRWAPPISSHH